MPPAQKSHCIWVHYQDPCCEEEDIKDNRLAEEDPVAKQEFEQYEFILST